MTKVLGWFKGLSTKWKVAVVGALIYLVGMGIANLPSDTEPKKAQGGKTEATAASSSTSSTELPTTTTAPKAKSYGPGSPAVFQEIAAETDCAKLQETFDRAEETSKRSGTVPNGPAFEGAQGRRWSEVGIAYMEASDDRMRQLGCY